MKHSYISSQVSKIGDNLKDSTQFQVFDYKQRFNVVKEMYNELLKDLIIQGFDSKKCFNFAFEFFNSPKVGFAAIEGTEYAREIFDLIIFFGGAYACIGEIEFNENSKPKIGYSEKMVEEGQGISSCVPLYINEIPEVDQTFLKKEKMK
ncbi:MAG: hypothetical protein QXJ25_03635 [Candidatus Aenigmatarchaeota archaeon]